ncbi:FAD binding domain-containing protein [Niallia sp. 03133]|uniref:FAD binding domain-containing protein n=1 Tax=Niallia sp. 03133 TaxID=3458060 RepID=UPI0040450035
METNDYQTVVEIPLTLAEINTDKLNESTLISGGTFLQLNWEAGQKRPSQLISLEKIKELKGIKEVSEGDLSFLEIGAATNLSECCKNILIQEYSKVLADACYKIAAPAVRNRGTIGGNICSKVGDSIPALLVLNAQLSIFNGEKEYLIPLKSWLETIKATDEPQILAKIRIPIEKNEKESYSFFKKVGRRESFTAAIISVAGYIKKANGKLVDVRMAIGGGAHSPVRLHAAEKMLINKNTADINLLSFYHAIENGFVSYTDPFVTELYRKKVAANLFFAQCKIGLEQES